MVGLRIHRDVELALRSAIHFLCAARDSAGEAGWWRDFSFYAGQSDEWVTAYTGAALAETEDSVARDAAVSAWSLLERRASEVRGGFGYNAATSCDADSSIWACRLADNVGAFSRTPVYNAIQFIRGCAREDGGIATFPSASAVYDMVEIPKGMRVDGWISSHVCVTAAAAALPCLDTNDRRRYLRRAQSAAGAWSAYWWMNQEYATALAVEALAVRPDDDDLIAIRKAVAWMESRGDSGTAFALALRVLGLCRSGHGNVSSALRRLIDLQLEDGSWPSSARLRQPPPSERNPGTRWYWDYTHKGFGCIRLDERRVFSTATALRALNAWLHT